VEDPVETVAAMVARPSSEELHILPAQSKCTRMALDETGALSLLWGYLKYEGGSCFAFVSECIWYEFPVDVINIWL
jgi:hypothetical protein